MLESFFTTLAVWPQDAYLSLLPQGIRQELLRRSYPVPRSRVHQAPWRELVRLGATRWQMGSLTRHEIGWASVDQVYQALDRWVAQKLQTGSIDAVYAYEDGALETFRAAKKLGIHCYYELPIGYWQVGQRIQLEEAQRQPEWAATLSAILDSPAKCARKDHELSLADRIFVASSFTQRTLTTAKFSGTVTIIPHGAPPVAPPKEPRSGPLRVLFVGSLSQRKGLSYVLEAVAQLNLSLTLIGRPVALCPPLERALNIHRWIPSLPHAQVLAEMRQHDVLVFPSLFEGFGLVLLEAMAQGLPVITTTHTAGPDVITDGVEGFLVPIRNSNAIAEKLSWLADHPQECWVMGESARQKAAQLSWKHHHQALIQALTQ